MGEVVVVGGGVMVFVPSLKALSWSTNDYKYFNTCYNDSKRPSILQSGMIQKTKQKSKSKKYQYKNAEQLFKNAVVNSF